MKRTALSRTAGLVRKARMATKRAVPRRSSRIEDPARVAAVHSLPCCARHLSACGGPIEADHAGKKSGMGRKADDATCIPLCRDHHSERHRFAGPFRAWTAPQMRAWLDSQIAITTEALHGAEHRRS